MPSIPDDIEALRRLLDEKFRKIEHRINQLEIQIAIDRRLTQIEQRMAQIEKEREEDKQAAEAFQQRLEHLKE